MKVEHIIKTKHYFELTAEELAEVSNYASTEMEFDEMKSFLMSTEQTVNSQKISSTPELDDKVLNYLNQSYTQVVPWYNSVLLFLFPRDKQFFKYPAFQLGIASLLVLGVFNLVNFSSFNEAKIAFEDVQKIKTKEQLRIEVVEKLKQNEAEIKQMLIESELVDDEIETRPSEFAKEKHLIQDELALGKDNSSLFKDNTFSSFYGLSDDVAEEVEDLYYEELPVVEYDKKMDDDLIELEDNSEDLIEAEYESVAVVNVAQSVSVPPMQLSRKDMDSEALGNKKLERAKSIAVSESKFKSIESIKAIKQVSIQSTPELFQLFFEVK